MSTKKVSPWKKSLEKRHEDAGQGAQININLIKKLKSIRTEKSKNENTEQIYYEIEHKNKQISGKAKGNLK
jgi:3-methyladenine DNA glycosylase AlkC